MMTWRAKIRTENGTLPGLGTSEGISNQPLNSVKSFFHSLGIFIASWKYISSLYPSSVPRGVKRSRQNSNCGPLSLSRMCGILCGLKTVWRKIRAKSASKDSLKQDQGEILDTDGLVTRWDESNRSVKSTIQSKPCLEVGNHDEGPKTRTWPRRNTGSNAIQKMQNHLGQRNPETLYDDHPRYCYERVSNFF